MVLSNLEQKLIFHLLDKTNYDVAISSGLTSEFFYLKDEAKIFEYTKKHSNEYKMPPTIQIIKEKFSMELTQPEETFEYLLNAVLEKHRLNIIQQSLLEIADKSKQGSLQAYTALQKIIFDSQKIFSNELRERNVIKNTSDRLEAYESRESRGNILEGAVFGFDVLDNHILGIRPGETCVVFARPGKGKSLFATQIAINNWKVGLKPLILSYEMEIEQIEKRLDCLYAGINPKRFDMGRMNDSEKDKYKKSLEKMEQSENDFIISYPEDRTVAEISRQVQAHECDLVIIDQLSFLEGEGEEGYLKVKNIVHDIDKMAKINRVPVILITQGNRGGLDNRKKEEMQQLHNIAFSDSVGQYASLVITMFQDDEMLVNDEMQIGIVKFRRGLPAKFLFKWDIDNALIDCMGYLGDNDGWYNDV